MTFSRSTLLRGRAVDLAERCQNIWQAANDNIANLAAFGLTQSKLKELAGKIETNNGTMNSPRDARVESATATKQLQQEFDALDIALTQKVDGLMEQFQKSEPQFYIEYKTARIIIDRPAGRTQRPISPAPAPAQPQL